MSALAAGVPSECSFDESPQANTYKEVSTPHKTKGYIAAQIRNINGKFNFKCHHKTVA